MSKLKFSQTILQKVSFDEMLFEKELRKALGQLVAEDREALRRWCYAQFPNFYGVLEQCFTPSSSATAF
jgi:hypothetical protein